MIGLIHKTDAAVLAMVLEDMQASGLIDLKPHKEISLEPDKEFSLAPEVQTTWSSKWEERHRDFQKPAPAYVPSRGGSI
jgi:hypothetical protein